MAAAPVKMETDGASMIKSEPDSMQIPQLEADDAYEDTGELEMPPQPQDVWLLRIPRPLFSHWNSFADDQEIQLGVMRRSKRTGKVRSRTSITEVLHNKADLHRSCQWNLIAREIPNWN